MSKKSSKAQVAEVIEAPKTVTLSANGGADSLNGREHCRTHYMHVVLCDAYQRSEALSMKTLVARTRELMTRESERNKTEQHRSYEKLDRTAPSHVNTMKKRFFIEKSDNNTWRLTALGAQSCGAEFSFAHSADIATAQANAIKTRRNAEAQAQRELLAALAEAQAKSAVK